MYEGGVGEVRGRNRKCTREAWEKVEVKVKAIMKSLNEG